MKRSDLDRANGDPLASDDLWDDSEIQKCDIFESSPDFSGLWRGSYTGGTWQGSQSAGDSLGRGLVASEPFALRGVNHNIYSQSTWAAGNPAAGTNYAVSDRRNVAYWRSKGARHIRLMFTMEWFQDSLSATIPDVGNAARLAYWNAFIGTVEYATSLGMYVMIEHYGWSTIAGNTRPMWKNSLIGGATFTNAHFANLYSQLATHFKSNPLVGYGMLNEPNSMSTMNWFAAAQAVITAIRATGSSQWIFVPGNGYSTWNWTSNTYDTAGTKRSNQYGWENANGVGMPLSDPLNRLVASPHIYIDDAGGSTYNMTAVGAGAQADAIVDRMKVTVDWARAFNLANPTTPIKVYLGEIGYRAGATNAGLGGNYDAATATLCWTNFITYLEANADIFIGYAWWGASDQGWWGDVGLTHFSVTPITAGGTYYGDTVNMDLIEGTFTP